MVAAGNLLALYYPPYEHLPLRVATFSDFFETYIRESWGAGTAR